MQQAINIILGVLTTYGLATILAEYDGPAKVFQKIRSSKLRPLFECSVCLSPYVALIPVLCLSMGFIEYLAVIGGSVILARNL